MSRDIIKLDQIDVTFHQKKRTITAVKDVTIHIQEGDIYGIVGYSGAGKSTLVRVINLLQKPSAGKITIDNDVIFDGKVTLTAEHLLVLLFHLTRPQPILQREYHREFRYFHRGYWPLLGNVCTIHSKVVRLSKPLHT